MFLGHKGNRSNRVVQDASWLRDISTRLYLVGSHQDRQVLQIVDRLAWKQYKSLRSSASSDGNPFVSAEDSHAMARGYSGLLLVLKNHLPGTENITLERLLSLTNFTLAITGYNPSATALEKLDIANTALQFLWFMLELKDRIRWEDHNFARTIGYMVFAQLRLVQTQHTLSPNEQHKFAEVLAYNDVIGLAGRILLLICTDEGNDYQNTLGMEDYLGSLTSLGKFLERPVRQAPELFTDSKVQWSKVNSYCVALRDAETSRRNPRSHVLRVLKYMMDAWSAYEPIRTGKRTPRSCAYPRCACGIIYKNESGVQYTCGRCNLATYCDSNCQNAHWKLPTSTCHKVICIR
ncbi:hypothetical protein FRC12_019029 [Ceratobasidium sp. 428]|nr:hypothetical protein FRC12_019029 [Ceratobasidium sp. 428]